METAVAVTIRPAREEDLEAILRIYNDEILNGVATWDYEPWSMERRRAWFGEHQDDPTCPVLVAEAGNGEVVGFAYLTRMSQKAGWRFTREDTIYLDPAFRGKGIGGVLLPALLDEARARGLRLIVASISSENVASLVLHRRCGFEVVGELRNAGYKFDRWLSTTYLQCDLGEPREIWGP